MVKEWVLKPLSLEVLAILPCQGLFRPIRGLDSLITQLIQRLQACHSARQLLTVITVIMVYDVSSYIPSGHAAWFFPSLSLLFRTEHTKIFNLLSPTHALVFSVFGIYMTPSLLLCVEEVFLELSCMWTAAHVLPGPKDQANIDMKPDVCSSCETRSVI